MSGLLVRPGDAVGGETDNAPSAIIWNKLPMDYREQGYELFDDFLTLNASGDGWTLVEGDSNAAISILAVEDGVIRLALSTSDNEEAYAQFGNAESAPFIIDSNKGQMFFEARLKASSVTDDVLGMFIGLAEEASAAANFIVDDGATFAAKDRFGFFVDPTDSDNVEVISATAAAANTDHVSALGAITADTYFKVGFYFDGKQTITPYFNGIPGTSFSPEDTGFPDGEEMAPIIAAKVSSAATLNLDVDWIRCVQLRD